MDDRDPDHGAGHGNCGDQSDVKRMLAYSAVAHTGFILTGVIAANRGGISGTLFYLAAYGFPRSGPSLS